MAQGWRGQSHGIEEAWQQEFAHISVDQEAESKLEARPGDKPKACPQSDPFLSTFKDSTISQDSSLTWVTSPETHEPHTKTSHSDHSPL